MEYIGQEIRVSTVDGRVFHGKLVVIDSNCNLVIESAEAQSGKLIIPSNQLAKIEKKL
jgi:small nuclear ribonucleoprotein (snRNP)-like protein